LQPIRIYSHLEELETVWGRKWGAQGEVGKLRSVVVCRPTENEVTREKKDNPNFLRLRLGVWNLEKLQTQHDEFVRVLKDEVPEVIEWDVTKVYTGPYHTTMILTPTRGFAVVINGGAIIGGVRAIGAWKAKEVLYTRMLVELGVPILYTVHGNGTFTGAHCIFIDPTHIVIGNLSIQGGDLGSLEGARQVAPILKMAGVEEIHITHLSPFVGDLDEGFTMADVGLGVYHGLPKETIEYLHKKKVSLIEVPYEEKVREAVNLLAIEPGKVVMPAGNPRTAKALRKEGIDVIEVELQEFATCGIGCRCLTLPLIREKEPTLEELEGRKAFMKRA